MGDGPHTSALDDRNELRGRRTAPGVSVRYGAPAPDGSRSSRNSVIAKLPSLLGTES